MQDKLSTYKTQFAALPEPLKKQILIRLGFSLGFFLLFILVLWAMFDWMAVVPVIGLSIFSIISAGILFSKAVAGDYVVIRGRCIEVTVTPIRKRSKSILIQTDEHIVQLMTKQRPKRIHKGVDLELYVAKNTHVYEKDGIQLLHTYLAINILRCAVQNQD